MTRESETAEQRLDTVNYIRLSMFSNPRTVSCSLQLDMNFRTVEKSMTFVDKVLENKLRAKQIVKEIVEAIKYRIDPIRVPGGLSEGYFFRNIRGECVAVVKPTDEEPDLKVGETGIREMVAYLLDHGHLATYLSLL